MGTLCCECRMKLSLRIGFNHGSPQPSRRGKTTFPTVPSLRPSGFLGHKIPRSLCWLTPPCVNLPMNWLKIQGRVMAFFVYNLWDIIRSPKAPKICQMLEAKTRISEDIADVGRASTSISVLLKIKYVEEVLLHQMRLKEHVLCEFEETRWQLKETTSAACRLQTAWPTKPKSLESRVFRIKYIYPQDIKSVYFSNRLFHLPRFPWSSPAMLAGAPPPLEDVGGLRSLRSWCEKMSMWDEDSSPRHEKVWCQILEIQHVFVLWCFTTHDLTLFTQVVVWM